MLTITSCSQSAYRHLHSMETTITVVHNDLVRAHAYRVTALMLLDLSSTFDTVDHDILSSFLERRFGVNGIELRWFRSYHEDRTKVFVVNGNSSTTHRVSCSVTWAQSSGVHFVHRRCVTGFLMTKHQAPFLR